MVKPQSRSAPRVPCTTLISLRGVCGRFRAELQDLSRTGLRLRIAQAALKLEPNAGIGSAASRIQTRVGSRFVVEFEDEGGRVALCRSVELIRLLLAGRNEVFLELGCAFDTPLSATDLQGLPVELPELGEAHSGVRQPAVWDCSQGPRLTPDALAGGVERLFDAGEENGGTVAPSNPATSVRAVLRGASGVSTAPLLCVAEDLTSAAVVLRIPAGAFAHPQGEELDAASATVALVEAFGDWPDLELVDGAQRLWRGGARVCEVEVAEDAADGLRVRLVLSRRLPEAELLRVSGPLDRA